MTNLVQTWLHKIGLNQSILDNFEGAGIVNPQDLAELDVSYYPALGVTEASDRKKLFYLVQRVKMAIPKDELVEDDTVASAEDIDLSSVRHSMGVGNTSGHSSGHSGFSKSLDGNEVEMQQAGESSADLNDILDDPEEEDDHDEDVYEKDHFHQGILSEEEEEEDAYTDQFEEDEEDDGIDEALQEQYRPLLSPSSNEYHTQTDDSYDDNTSEEDVPSPPPPSSSDEEDDNDDDEPPSLRHQQRFAKKEAEVTVSRRKRTNPAARNGKPSGSTGGGGGKRPNSAAGGREGTTRTRNSSHAAAAAATSTRRSKKVQETGSGTHVVTSTSRRQGPKGHKKEATNKPTSSSSRTKKSPLRKSLGGMFKKKEKASSHSKSPLRRLVGSGKGSKSKKDLYESRHTTHSNLEHSRLESPPSSPPMQSGTDHAFSDLEPIGASTSSTSAGGAGGPTRPSVGGRKSSLPRMTRRTTRSSAGGVATSSAIGAMAVTLSTPLSNTSLSSSTTSTTNATGSSSNRPRMSSIENQKSNSRASLSTKVPPGKRKPQGKTKVIRAKKTTTSRFQRLSMSASSSLHSGDEDVSTSPMENEPSTSKPIRERSTTTTKKDVINLLVDDEADITTMTKEEIDISFELDQLTFDRPAEQFMFDQPAVVAPPTIQKMEIASPNPVAPNKTDTRRLSGLTSIRNSNQHTSTKQGNLVTGSETVAQRRISRRLQEKRLRESGKSSSEDEIGQFEGSTQFQNLSFGFDQIALETNGKENEGDEISEWDGLSPRSSGTNVSSSSGSTLLSTKSNPTKDRRSKIPNPSAGREKKRLSTIPSDRVAPMPSERIDESNDFLDEAIDAVKCEESFSSIKSERKGKRISPVSRPFLVETDLNDMDYEMAPRSKSTSLIENSSPPKADSPPNIKSSSMRPELTHSKSFDSVDNGVMKKKTTTTNGAVYVHGEKKDKSWTGRVNKIREANETAHKDVEVIDTEEGFEEEMRIRVIVRKRPMSRKEAAGKDEVDVIHPLTYGDYGRILVYQPKTRVDLTKELETLPFAFDNVFGEKSSNCQIYDETIRNLIPGAFEGRWASVFAYGQTGSGKTFTMMGSGMTGKKDRNRKVNHDENHGLYYMAAKDLFEFASYEEYSHLAVGASLFEIYGGKLFDLLNERNPVKCLENHKGKVCFPGLSEHPIANAEELMGLIEAGSLIRSTGSTSANRDSSRSHAVLQLHLRKSNARKANIEHGRLTFIDLAGSERGADTNQASRTTRLEGADINTSLLALKEVIRALATGDSMAHIPFRGSKLTQVLKESFIGKNSRTVMVACVAPNITNCDHTLNTLRYADRVKERDSETGKLAASVAAASKIHKKASEPPVRPVSAPPAGSDLSRINSQKSLTYKDRASMDETGDEESDDNWLSEQLDTDDQHYQDIDDNDEADLHDFDELNEVLKTPPSSSKRNRGGTSTFEDQYAPKRVSKREAVAPLITSHRSVMSEMLTMVKQEMTLVNCTDADRALIDEYLDELETIQEKQLSMISSLRESLVEYYAVRPQDMEDDEDNSFDDLRSL